MRILYPIELLLKSVFSFSYNLTGHYGYALILMSVCITLITTPIYFLADLWKNEEKKIQDLMKNDIDCIKLHYSGQKQFYLIQATHRIFNYKAWYPLRTSLGILIEIPFFFAAYDVLSSFKGYTGISFGPIHDLSLPDGLVLGINILPILMTLLNVISSIMFTRSFKLKDNTQQFVLAAVFLLFLYESPSALLIYWTFNNFFSLIKNTVVELVKKNKEKFTIVSFKKDILPNRHIIILILCTLLFLLFTYIQTYRHGLIKFVFLLYTFIQGLLFIYFIFIKRRKLSLGLIFAYFLYAIFTFFYFVKIYIFDFDTALFIINILNAVLIYAHLCPSHEEAEPVKNRITISIISSFILTFILPLQIYLGNKMEFPVNLTVVSGLLLLSFIAVSAVLIILSCFIFKKNNFISNTLFFVLILYFFNGIFIPLNAGMMQEFSFQHSAVVNHPELSLFLKDFIIILFSFYIVSYITTTKKSFKIPLLFIFTAVFLFSTLYTGIKYKDVKEIVKTESTDLPENSAIVHQFSTKGTNVLIFMSDMMNGSYFDRIIEEHPELNSTLSGFTWYKDCLTRGSDTNTAMPVIYGGEEFSIINFNKNGLTTKEQMEIACDKMMKPFLENNYLSVIETCSDLFNPGRETLANPNTIHTFDSDYQNYYANRMDIDNSSFGKVYLLQMLPLYSFMPNTAKQYIYQGSRWNNPDLQLREQQIISSKNLSHAILIPELVNFTDDDTNNFKFFTSCITHYPWGIGADNELISTASDLKYSDEERSYFSARESILLLAETVEKLKANNAYDNTVIIFCSDHGNQLENSPLSKMDLPQLTDPDYHYHLSMAHTLLLIKGLNESDELSISDAQVQNSDIISYIQEKLFNNGTDFSRALSYTKENPRERTYSIDLYKKNDFYEITNIPCINFKVTGPINEPSSWSMYED